MQPEARLVKKIQQFAKSKGARCTKVWGSDESPQEVGIADLLVCYKGLFLAWEVKLPGAEKTLSPRQKYYLDSIRAAGGIAEVITSVAEARRSLAKASRIGGK